MQAPMVRVLVFVVAGLFVSAVASCSATPPAARASVVAPADGSSSDASTESADREVASPPEASDGGADAEAVVAEADASGEAEAGTAADAGEGETASGLCARFCGVLALTACPPESAACVSACEEQLADLCGDEARASFACQSALGPGDFSCDSRGRQVLNPGLCPSENQALIDCLTGE